MLLMAMLLFPKLALGLSGFETGVAVMPLVRGDESDTEQAPLGRIRNTKKLLATAALIMSVMLMGSSLVTAVIIPAGAFQPHQPADGRALAYLAHELIGNGFGTVYDVATIAILWFAGASAMAGLLNLVPRYLPRYGMAPEWARATRPLVALFTGITFLVTIIFDANVDAQGGAYATGVLVLMSSAALAVAIMAWRQRRHYVPFAIDHARVRLHHGHQHLRASRGHQDRLGVHPDHHRHVARLARAAIDRAARRRHRRRRARVGVHRRRRERRRRRPDYREPAPDRRAEEYEQKLREASDAHHIPAGATRCCFSRSVPATPRSSARC